MVMPNIYLLVGETQKGPYSEKDVQDMYVAGTITAETMHWREGMPNWQNIGLRDPKTGRPRSEPNTVAPPRRSQLPGEALSYEPIDLKRKNLKTEFSSARNKPLTFAKALSLIAFAFIILTIFIIVLNRTIPDAGKLFEQQVTTARNKSDHPSR